MTRRKWKAFAWTVAALLLVYLFVTTFVVQLRYVDSSSMEPTIFGSAENGEWVAVRLDGTPPERYDVVVLDNGLDGLVVKRVWGLPGERVSIRYGDVWVDEELLPPDPARPDLIPVFDDRWHDLADSFVVEDTAWHRDGDSWIVEAADVEPGTDGAMVFLHKKVLDSYLDRDHRVIEGSRRVNDLRAELELRFEEWVVGAAFRIDLREWGDSFEASLEPESDEAVRVSIARRSVDGSTEVLARESLALRPDAANRVAFSNVDNRLTVVVTRPDDSREVLEASYDTNTYAEFDDLLLDRTRANQVQFAAARSRVRVRAVRLARDLFFTHRGTFAVESPLQLSMDELLVLGDNSARSRDGRELGPTPLRDVFGRVRRVVWPLSSWRRLDER